MEIDGRSSDNICNWGRSFDGHINMSCADESKQRANGNFKGKENGAKWEFIYCPYCGGLINMQEQVKED